MTKAILKTILRDGENFVLLPRGAIPISVHVQYGNPTLWAICDVSEPVEPLPIFIAPTGVALPENTDQFVGTFMLAGGALIFHVFTLTQGT